MIYTTSQPHNPNLALLIGGAVVVIALVVILLVTTAKGGKSTTKTLVDGTKYNAGTDIQNLAFELKKGHTDCADIAPFSRVNGLSDAQFVAMYDDFNRVFTADVTFENQRLLPILLAYKGGIYNNFATNYYCGRDATMVIAEIERTIARCNALNLQ